MNGWVKLHKKILDNEFLQNDINAYIVFTKLLMAVNTKSGSFTTGRYKLETLMSLKGSTIYKTLKRLEKAGMVTQVSNNRYTIISICNWDNYQGNGNRSGNNQVTTKSQPSNTNKEIRNKNKEIVSKDTRVSKLYYDYLKKYRIPITNHNILRKKIKELEDINGIEWSVKYLTFMLEVYESLDMKYKPEINDSLDLFKKSKSIEEKLKKHNQLEEVY